APPADGVDRQPTGAAQARRRAWGLGAAAGAHAEAAAEGEVGRDPAFQALPARAATAARRAGGREGAPAAAAQEIGARFRTSPASSGWDVPSSLPGPARECRPRCALVATPWRVGSSA